MRRREDLPLLAVILHSPLRERGLFELMQEARVVAITTPHSPAHRLADYACPIPQLDLDAAATEAVFAALERRGLRIDGALALRDGNVLPLAQVLDARGLPNPFGHASRVEHCVHKADFRAWLNPRADAIGCRRLPHLLIPRHTPWETFDRQLSAFSARQAILKPARGSCSQHIASVDVTAPSSRRKAYETYQGGAAFRGGTFLLEERVEGTEYAVETVVHAGGMEVFHLRYAPLQGGRFCTVGAATPLCPADDGAAEATLDAVARRLHTHLGYVAAITHTEFIVPHDGSPPVLIEHNPRPGGGMCQEMYRIVNGVQMYRIAANLALSPRAPLDPTLLRGTPVADAAVIRFAQPANGILKLAERPTVELQHAEDRLSVLFSPDTQVHDHGSDDDLVAWALACGHREENETLGSLQRRLSDHVQRLLEDRVETVPTAGREE